MISWAQSQSDQQMWTVLRPIVMKPMGRGSPAPEQTHCWELRVCSKVQSEKLLQRGGGGTQKDSRRKVGYWPYCSSSAGVREWRSQGVSRRIDTLQVQMTALGLERNKKEQSWDVKRFGGFPSGNKGWKCFPLEKTAVDKVESRHCSYRQTDFFFSSFIFHMCAVQCDQQSHLGHKKKGRTTLKMSMECFYHVRKSTMIAVVFFCSTLRWPQRKNIQSPSQLN